MRVRALSVLAAAVLIATTAHGAPAGRPRVASADVVPDDPCQGAPVEIVFTVAAPTKESEAIEILEGARTRPDAIARRRAVLTDGLDVAPDPGTHEELFYPVHRILLVLFRPVC